MPEIWPDPDNFDPLRFTDEAQRNRHRFAWVPFGGGAHMCLGLHFAYMQAKTFARHFLQNLEVSLEPGYRPDWQMWPIPKPATDCVWCSRRCEVRALRQYRPTR